MLHLNTLILHIGSWKTGTTSIQSFLARNAARLKEDGILYPRTSRDGDGGTETAHHRLCAILGAADGKTTRDIAAILRGIDAEMRASGCRDLLLSSETFMGLNRPEIMARYFTADQVIIVVSLRHQADFVNAMYYTDVCHLKVIDQPVDYLAAFDRRLLNYLGTLDRWSAIWPGARMRVALFDPGSPARAFPVRHFLNTIGLDWTLDDADNAREHATQPAQATLVLRHLVEAGYSDAEFYEIFQVFQRHPHLFAPARAHLPPQVMRNIEVSYAGQNRQLVDKYLPEGSDGFAPITLPDQNDWAAVVKPSGTLFPDFVRGIARQAAAQPGRSRP